MTLSEEMARETICRTASSNSSGDFPLPSLMLLASTARTAASPARRAVVNNTTLEKIRASY